jgi:hypothetical protein
VKKSAQLAQLLGSSQRPWMKTTGVLPEALAASISRRSRSEIDVMPDSPSVGYVNVGSVIRVGRPAPIGHAPAKTGQGRKL